MAKRSDAASVLKRECALMRTRIDESPGDPCMSSAVMAQATVLRRAISAVWAERRRRLEAARPPRTLTDLEKVRADVSRMFVSKADRLELDNAGVYAPGRLTNNRRCMDYAEAARFLAREYPSIGVREDDDIAKVVSTLYHGCAADFGKIDEPF